MDPGISKTLSKLNCLLKKVVTIKIVANIFIPIIKLITSFTPVNLTTPLCELTIRKLVKAAIKTNGICFKKAIKSKSISKL